MSKTKKRKPINVVRVSRAKKDDEEGIYYSTFDMMIEEHFPSLRELDYVIYLQKNWRADADDNRKWMEARLCNEIDRHRTHKGDGRDCVFRLNYDIFNADADEAKNDPGWKPMFQFHVFNVLSSIDHKLDADGEAVRDESGRKVYRRRRAPIQVFPEAFASFGTGAVRPLMDLAVMCKKRSTGAYEMEQRMFWPEEREEELDTELNESSELEEAVA